MTGIHNQGNEDHDAGGDAADAHELMLRGVGPPFLIEIHGEQCRTGVEDSGQRPH